MIYTKEYLTTTPLKIKLGDDYEKNLFALKELCRITDFTFGLKNIII